MESSDQAASGALGVGGVICLGNVTDGKGGAVVGLAGSIYVAVGSDGIVWCNGMRRHVEPFFFLGFK